MVSYFKTKQFDFHENFNEKKKSIEPNTLGSQSQGKILNGVSNNIYSTCSTVKFEILVQIQFYLIIISANIVWGGRGQK